MTLINRHIIIGDIHGCNIELNLLVEKLEFTKKDSLYFIGDLLDKGVVSVGVVKTVYSLSQEYNVNLILGNHEVKFLRYVKNKETNPAVLNSMKNIDEFQGIFNEITSLELEMLKNAYFFYKIPGFNYLLIHAGLPPTVNIEVNNPPVFGKHFLKKYKNLKLLTMTRNLDKNGVFLSIGQDKEEMYFWAEKYDGRHGTIIFGHESFIGREIKRFDNAIGIDTGCVYGGCLTALIIGPGNKISTENQPLINKVI